MKKFLLSVILLLLSVNSYAIPEVDAVNQLLNGSGLNIARGLSPKTSFVHKFGSASDFDIDAGIITVWDGANDALGLAFAYTYSATADITQITSSSASDTEIIEVQGLNSAYELVIQNVTLTGTTAAILETPLIRVFRMKNIGSADMVGTVYLTVSGAGYAAAGVPDTANEIRAMLSIGENQTLMALYTCPANKTCYLCSFYASTSSAIKTSAHIIRLKVRPFGQVFQTKHVASIIANGVGHFIHPYMVPEKISAKSDIEMRANTDSNVAGVSAGFDLIVIDD